MKLLICLSIIFINVVSFPVFAQWGQAGFSIYGGQINPPILTSDGLISNAPNGGSLTTTAGVWTWGAAAAGRPGEYIVLLNNVDTGGIGNLIEIANNGKLYVDTVGFGWFVWNGSSYDSTPQGLPIVKFSPDIITNLPDSTVPGTTVSTITTLNADGSTYLGPLSFPNGGNPLNAFSLSGNNIVVSSNGVPQGPRSTFVMVQQQSGINARATLFITITHTPVSPDGKMSNAPNGGVLVTGAGTWSWGSAVDATNYQILLNGIAVDSGSLLEVANSSQIYKRFNGNWYSYTLGCTMPSCFTTLIGPNFLPFMIFNPNFVSNLVDNTPVGTTVDTISATNADGTPYTGNFTLTSNPGNYFAVSGSNITVNTGGLPPGTSTRTLTVQMGP